MNRRSLTKVASILFLGIALVVTLLKIGGWWMDRESALPSDQKALAYFQGHKQDFDALLSRLQQEQPNGVMG